jgi:integrase/recombinase XerD
MKRSSTPELARLIQQFFEDYLPGLRGMSAHTIHSYRDAVVLFLRYRNAAPARDRDIANHGSYGDAGGGFSPVPREGPT